MFVDFGAIFETKGQYWYITYGESIFARAKYFPGAFKKVSEDKFEFLVCNEYLEKIQSVDFRHKETEELKNPNVLLWNNIRKVPIDPCDGCIPININVTYEDGLDCRILRFRKTDSFELWAFSNNIENKKNYYIDSGNGDLYNRKIIDGKIQYEKTQRAIR